jgi:cell division protein ZapA
MDKSIITVNIFGNEYTIKGVAEPEYIVTLANYLNNKMSEVQDATGIKDAKKIAILAAINIADELFESKKQIKDSTVPKEQLQVIRNKVENLISMIDKELPSEPYHEEPSASLVEPEPVNNNPGPKHENKNKSGNESPDKK